MSRYQVLYKNDESMYTDDCPLIILNHALTLDGEKDAVLAQIKFQNLGQRIVKAVYIDIKCIGMANEELEGLENYVYLDLSVRPDQQFGGDIPVYLPDSKTRKVEIRCNKIIFNDNTLWENDLEDFYDKFPPKVLLNDIMEPKLFKMLAEDVHKSGVHCNELYFPSEIKMFRLCPCGKYNWKNEPVCWNCGHDADWWKTRISKEYLNQQIEKKEEKEKLFQLEKQCLEREREIKKQKTIVKVKKCTIPIAIMVMIVIAYFVYNKVILPKYYYNKGDELFNTRNYEEAIEYYEKANYKDSREKVNIASNQMNYDRGNELFNAQKYDEAIRYYQKTNGYLDSVYKIYEAKLRIKSPELLSTVDQELMDIQLINYIAYLDITYAESGFTSTQSNSVSGLKYYLGEAVFLGEECPVDICYPNTDSDSTASGINIKYRPFSKHEISAEELANILSKKLNTNKVDQFARDFYIEIPHTTYEIRIDGWVDNILVCRKDNITKRAIDFEYGTSPEEVIAAIGTPDRIYEYKVGDQAYIYGNQELGGKSGQVTYNFINNELIKIIFDRGDNIGDLLSGQRILLKEEKEEFDSGTMEIYESIYGYFENNYDKVKNRNDMWTNGTEEILVQYLNFDEYYDVLIFWRGKTQ